MNFLVLGSGGREHALTWKISLSKDVDKIFVAPGNAGTATIAENIDIAPDDFPALLDFCKKNKVDYVVVGPEQPLVNGVFDYFMDTGIFVIGPSRAAAQLEGSKAFAKAFMQKYNIPTAQYRAFSSDQYQEAVDFMKSLTPPYVIKASGLAAGKGVVILNDFDQAANDLKQIFSGKFGQAGQTVVIEQYLRGVEMSVFIITDGKNYKILPTSKDYKRIGEGDTGLNTGGMGAISPMPLADKKMLDLIEKKIIKPTIHGIRNEGMFYRGFLYFGLMIADGEPYVLEYNVRFGDPETQAVLPRITTDFVEVLEAMVNETVEELDLKITSDVAATVILASGGYPEKYEKGKLITGLDQVKDSIVFHAGTKLTDSGVTTSGGRVLAVTSLAPTLEQALEKSYSAIEKIHFDRMYFRRDIGYEFV